MVIFMEAVCVVHVEEVKIVENKNLKIRRLCSFYVFFFFLVAKIIRLFTHFPVLSGSPNLLAQINTIHWLV